MSFSDLACRVFDGSAVLWVVHWPTNGTVLDFVNVIKSYIQSKLADGDVYLVFDRYRQYSTKSVTRAGRARDGSRVYQLSPRTMLPAQNVVLTNLQNKKQLIDIITNEITQDKVFQQHQAFITHKLVITANDEVAVEISNGLIRQ